MSDDAVLEQVADALGALGEQVERVLGLDVLREDEHARAGMPLADLARGPQPLVGVRRRHPDVDDRDVRAVGAHLQHQLLGVARLPDDLEARVLEQPRDPLAQEHRVVGQHDAHRAEPTPRDAARARGISAATRVPPPGGLSTTSRPSSASTRSARPRSPEPGRRRRRRRRRRRPRSRNVPFTRLEADADRRGAARA